MKLSPIKNQLIVQSLKGLLGKLISRQASLRPFKLSKGVELSPFMRRETSKNGENAFHKLQANLQRNISFYFPRDLFHQNFFNFHHFHLLFKLSYGEKPIDYKLGTQLGNYMYVTRHLAIQSKNRRMIQSGDGDQACH